ncbi:Uncharacterized membrane protein YpjA [Paenibacillus sp. UNCCL117]|uniref:DUF1405 domain-containing protein n=1 Tax=unclassified Paenibacillus TaxID=185978 RepID=UPI000885D7CE|nr:MULTISPECIES: DUF1405 domain-containing protein [unclassified Paenibacillus]SDC41413.1 Uncharacterized membrane protein YpjA [Paenibacillus sp. cl123]SFW13529.1 Uncharacterized membrane protein YpjA [Paenibacillus sp. UNCCL117]
MDGWRLSYFVSRAFLGGRLMLLLMLLVNVPGTVYGYIWYGNQLAFTWEAFGPALLPFVPDSPTASLFFSLFLLYLLKDIDAGRGFAIPPERVGLGRGVVEAFALITSFKYGIWAVAMIWAGAWQGEAVSGQDWMLTLSHLGMAAEALLYVRFYRFSLGAVVIVGAWSLWNDAMDYGVGVFPWLAEVLQDDLTTIQWFTVGLSLIGIAIATAVWLMRTRK